MILYHGSTELSVDVPEIRKGDVYLQKYYTINGLCIPTKY